MVALAVACSCTSGSDVTSPCGPAELQDAAGCFSVGADVSQLPERSGVANCAEHEIPLPDGSCERVGPSGACLTPQDVSSLAAPVYVVDPMGYFQGVQVADRSTTIQSAIDQAPEGATILLGPGEFRESIIITKQMSVRGVCAQNTTLIGENTARAQVEIEAKEVWFSSLAIRGRSLGIHVSRGGSATVEDIDIRGVGDIALYSEGDLVARRNRIREAWFDPDIHPGSEPRGAGGISVWEHPLQPLRAEIEKNIVESIKGDGIGTNASSFSIRMNWISGLEACCGPMVSEATRHAGIHLRVSPGGDGPAVVESNVMKSNRNWAGISYRRKQTGVIRNNVILDQRAVPEDPDTHYDEANESRGIWVRSGAPLIQNNHLSGIGGRGVVFDEQADATPLIFESNVVNNCESHCLSVFGPGASYVIRNNLITDAGRPATEGLRDIAGGMWLLFGSFEIDGNTVSDCDLVGIGLLNSQATLVGNLIERIRVASFALPGGIEITAGDGVMTLFETDLGAAGNVFHANGRGGMLLDTAGVIGLPQLNGVSAALEGNAFAENAEFGLFIQNGARAVMGEGVRAGVRAGVRGGARLGSKNQFRANAVQVGLTQDARDGVRAAGSDEGLASAFSVRAQAMDSVRLEAGAVLGGVRGSTAR